jgi:hypothetical protein
VLVALGLVRAIALLRRGTGATWRDAIGAFFVWQSTSLVVARASVVGLFARKAAFLRTPKTSETGAWWQAFRANWAESLLALLGFLGIAAGLSRLDSYSGPLLAGLLVFPTLGLAAAPFNSLAARRAALPAELRERRRTEWSREQRTLVGGAAAGGTAGVLVGLAVLLGLLVAPSAHLVNPPQLVNPPHQNQQPTPAPSSPGPPSPGPSSPAPSGPGSTPTPSSSTGGSPTSGPGPTTTPAPTGTGAGTGAPPGPTPT